MRPDWIKSVLALARQAGEATLSYHTSADSSPRARVALPMQVTRKTDNSPVTLADLAANQLIVQGLARIAPEVPVVSEELPESLIHLQAKGRCWLVDPLDGTREFVAGGDDFTVNIALIEDGRSVWGVVYAPVLQRMYWGGRASGSFRSRDGRIEALKVSPLPDRHKAFRVVASKSHLNTGTRSFIDHLGQVDLVQAGSSLKFCLVAQGDADVYPRLGDTAQWDTAAAQAVLEGAGGVVCDLDGNALSYGGPDVLNPYFIAASSHPDNWLRNWQHRQAGP